MKIRNLFIIIVPCAIATAAYSQTINSTYTGPNNGLWSDPGNWSPKVVPNNTGGKDFNVAIDGMRVRLDLDATVSNLNLNSDGSQVVDNEHQFTVGSTTVGAGLVELIGTGTVNLGNLSDFSNQTLNSGMLTVDANMPGQIAKLQFNGADIVNNYGLIRFMGPDARLEDENGNDALAHLALNGAGGSLVRLGYGSTLSLSTDFRNEGLFILRQGSTATFSGSYTSVPGDGDDGLLEFYGTDFGARSGDGSVIVTGTFANQDSSGVLSGKFFLWSYGTATTTLQYNDADITDISGDLLLQGPNARIVDQKGNDALRNWSANHSQNFGAQVGARTQNIKGNFANHGIFSLLGGAQFNVAGNLTSDNLIVMDAYDLYLDVGFAGFPHVPELALPVHLDVAGDLSLSPTHMLWIGFVDQQLVGKITVGGTATLGGELTPIFTLNDDSAITPDSVLTILSSNHPITGQFSNVASGERVNAYFYTADIVPRDDPRGSFRVDYSGNEVTLSDYQPAAPAELRNISTRLDVQTDDNAGIAGFIVTGTGSKEVLLRGIGPSLNTVPGHLDDTVIELRDSSGALLVANDDWRQSAQSAAIEATGLAPTDDRESAILQSLPPGAYSAIIRGKDNTSGIGLVEAYDIGGEPDARLANLSTRGFVEAGDNVMIGGLIAGNPNTALTTMVVRALGPSLSQFGVSNSLQDPVLEVRDADGNLTASNDNWMSDQQAEIESHGLGLSDSREAAVVFTMASGLRTVLVSGVNATTGVGLVEIYNVAAPIQTQPNLSTHLRPLRPRQPHTRRGKQVIEAH